MSLRRIPDTVALALVWILEGWPEAGFDQGQECVTLMPQIQSWPHQMRACVKLSEPLLHRPFGLVMESEALVSVSFLFALVCSMNPAFA